jgi:hypothetical protein
MYQYQIFNFLLKNLPHRNFFVGPYDVLPKNFKLPAAFIFNTSSSFEPGTHWQALVISENGTGYFFDSYGMKPMIKEVNHFIRLHCKSIIFNTKQLQQTNSHFCGHYCAMFVYFLTHRLTMDKYLAHFTNNLFINDIVVEQMYNSHDK